MTKVEDMSDAQIIVQARRMKASKYSNSQISQTLQITPRSVTSIFAKDNSRYGSELVSYKVVIERGLDCKLDY